MPAPHELQVRGVGRRGIRRLLRRHADVAQTLQNLTLLALSYVFYALWDWRWCTLLAGVTATGFLGALLLARLEAHRSLFTGRPPSYGD